MVGEPPLYGQQGPYGLTDESSDGQIEDDRLSMGMPLHGRRRCTHHSSTTAPFSCPGGDGAIMGNGKVLNGGGRGSIGIAGGADGVIP